MAVALAVVEAACVVDELAVPAVVLTVAGGETETVLSGLEVKAVLVAIAVPAVVSDGPTGATVVELRRESPSVVVVGPALEVAAVMVMMVVAVLETKGSLPVESTADVVPMVSVVVEEALAVEERVVELCMTDVVTVVVSEADV